MPKPYETQCVDYQKKGYTSIRDCIYQCRMKYVAEKWPHIWPGTYLNYEERTELNISDTFDFWLRRYHEDVQIGDSCKNVCELHSECYSELYEVFLHKHDRQFNHFYLPIFPPNMPDLIYTYSPSIQLVEFLSYLGSTISLYFGFSLVMLSDLILKFSKYVWNKYHFISINNRIFMKSSKQRRRRRTHSWASLKRATTQRTHSPLSNSPRLSRTFIIDDQFRQLLICSA